MKEEIPEYTQPNISETPIDEIPRVEYDGPIQPQQQLTLQEQSSALEEVNKMEETMMQITALLNHFSVLISDQQEEINIIHDKAKESEENIEKGTDNLVQATERTKHSGHYTAKFIVFLGALLLFFNSIT